MRSHVQVQTPPDSDASNPLVVLIDLSVDGLQCATCHTDIGWTSYAGWVPLFIANDARFFCEGCA